MINYDDLLIELLDHIDRAHLTLHEDMDFRKAAEDMIDQGDKIRRMIKNESV